MAYNILLMGASYGSLLASKLLFGGHSIHLRSWGMRRSWRMRRRRH